MKLTTIFYFLFVVSVAHAQSVLTPFVPNSSENVEGNSASDRPFNQTGVRYQQVYAASQFSPVPGWIREIDFRVDITPQGGQSFFATLSNIQINLSTTLRQPDGLSAVFADNVGTDEIVTRSGSLRLMSLAGHLPGQPNFADAGILLSNRFFYDPAQGNLLLDVRNYFGAATAPFDAVNTFGDSVSSLFSVGADSTIGSQNTLGLVTGFVIDPVPEPPTWALFAIGPLILVAFGYRKRHARLARHKPVG